MEFEPTYTELLTCLEMGSDASGAALDSRNFGYYGSCAYGAIDTDAEALGQARPNRRLVH